jgi:hypothetical protein
MEIESTTLGTITIDGKTYVFNRSHARKIGLFQLTC